jgi:hypothetical protein
MVKSASWPSELKYKTQGRNANKKGRKRVTMNIRLLQVQGT